jgi:hypothetical protein
MNYLGWQMPKQRLRFSWTILREKRAGFLRKGVDIEQTGRLVVVLLVLVSFPEDVDNRSGPWDFLLQIGRTVSVNGTGQIPYFRYLFSEHDSFFLTLYISMFMRIIFISSFRF